MPIKAEPELTGASEWPSDWRCAARYHLVSRSGPTKLEPKLSSPKIKPPSPEVEPPKAPEVEPPKSPEIKFPKTPEIKPPSPEIKPPKTPDPSHPAPQC